MVNKERSGYYIHIIIDRMSIKLNTFVIGKLHKIFSRIININLYKVK